MDAPAINSAEAGGTAPDENSKSHGFQGYHRQNKLKRLREQGNRCQFSKTVDALEDYMKKTMKYLEDLTPLLFSLEMVLPKIAYPQGRGPNPSKVEEAIWTEEKREDVKQACTLVGNLATGTAVIWGKCCCEAMKSKIKSHNQFSTRWAENYRAGWLVNFKP